MQYYSFLFNECFSALHLYQQNNKIFEVLITTILWGDETGRHAALSRRWRNWEKPRRKPWLTTLWRFESSPYSG